jgi:hypothetical protein
MEGLVMASIATTRTVRRAGVLMIATALAFVVAAPAVDAAQGSGNPILSVSRNTLPTTGATTITITGTDYLVPPHAPGANVFGGVYLFFGWVRPSGGWGPSIRNSNNNDGNYGSTYTYPGDGGDAGTRDDPEGRMRFISFTSGGTSGSATPYHMDDNGNWSTTMNIHGPTFSWENEAAGTSGTVDCRVVQCGVFTIGAHGKASATNEKFTPINFVNPTTPTTQGNGGGGNGGGGNNGGGTNNGGGGTNNGGSGGPSATWPNLGSIGSLGDLTTTTLAGGPSTTGAPTDKKKAVVKKNAVEKKREEAKATAGKTVTDDPNGDGDSQVIAAQPTAATSESGAPVLLIILVILAVASIAAGSIVFFRRRMATSTDAG